MFFKRKEACASLSMPEAERALEKDASIVLLDVRTGEEYLEGHIPKSLHLPLHHIMKITAMLPDKNVRLFVYCHSGARSEIACTQLSKLGYRDVTNIGGIVEWTGALEKRAGA